MDNFFTSLPPQSFLILAGVPAAGKSTFIEHLVSLRPDAVVISSDAQIEARAAAEGLSYHQAYIIHNVSVKAEIFTMAGAALASGAFVVWDQTNLDPATRAERLALVPEDYVAVAVAFEVDEAEQAERLRRREQETGKHIPEVVLAKQRAAYVRPAEDEGFDHVVVNPQREPVSSPGMRR